MNPNNHATLPERMSEHFQRQIEVYHRALAATEALIHPVPPVTSVEQRMETLKTIMDEARSLEQVTSNLNREWTDQGLVGDTALKQKRAEVLRLLETLITNCGLIENQVQVGKDNLAPRMSEHVKVRKTQSAYGKSP